MNEIKRLFPYLRPYRGTIILTLLLGIILSTVTLGTAKIVQLIIDDIFVAKKMEYLYLAPLFITGIYFVAGILRFAHMYLLRYTGDRISVDIRNDIERKFTDLSLDFHTSHSSGALISKTTNDVIMVQLGLTLLSDVIREPINAIAVLGYLFYTNWHLAILILFAAPILIFASGKIGRSVRKYSHQMQETNERIISVLKETLDGIRIIKAFSLEKHLHDQFRKTGDSFLFVRRKILSREELAGPLFEFMAALVFSGILFYAGFQIMKGDSTPGAFLSFVYALGMLQPPIKKLQDAHVRLQHTVASSQRVFEILDTPVTVRDPEESGRQRKTWPTNWQSIQFENVQFSYGSRHVLRGVDLNVRRGEVIAIVGSSGAGKTTFVNMIPRFYDVTGGSIKVESVDVRDLTLHDLRQNIALVSQDVFLFNESIKANILAGKEDANNEDVNASLVAAHAQHFVNHLPKKSETVVGDRGSRLSGGERQRISIARALYKNAPILILDEATSSLDSESEQEVQRALDELMEGRTTFVIAHRLSTIQKAHRIVVLSEGKIAEVGSHSELLAKKGHYQRLYDIQFKQI